MEHIELLQECLVDGSDVPAEYILLKNCASTHLLRAAGSQINEDELTELDDIILKSIIRILDEKISNETNIQVTLPIFRGGLGLSSALKLWYTAFIEVRVEIGPFVAHLYYGIGSIFGIGHILYQRYTDDLQNVFDNFRA